MSILIPNKLQTDFPYLSESKKVYIPKYIHQIYFDFNQKEENDKEESYYWNRIPEIWKNVPDSWKYQNKDWNYVFWNNNNAIKLVKEHFPWFLETYNNFIYPIQRVDAIRYMFLYVYGGIYVDMDIFCKKPIEDLFYKDFDVYLLKTPNTGIITNCFIASKPKSEYWIHVLKNMIEVNKKPSIFWFTKHIYVMFTTGPSLLENCYKSFNDKEKIKYLPSEFLFPAECNVCSEKPCTTNGAYTIILEGSSWCSNDTNVFSFFYCNYHFLLPIILSAIIVYIFCWYSNL
jgi:mannosyltransferase OCH1-like enzyme